MNNSSMFSGYLLQSKDLNKVKLAHGSCRYRVYTCSKQSGIYYFKSYRVRLKLDRATCVWSLNLCFRQTFAHTGASVMLWSLVLDYFLIFWTVKYSVAYHSFFRHMAQVSAEILCNLSEILFPFFSFLVVLLIMNYSC